MERRGEMVFCGVLERNCSSSIRHDGIPQAGPGGGAGRHWPIRVGELADVFGRACIGAAKSTRTAESDSADRREPDRGWKTLRKQLRGMPWHAGKTVGRHWR